MGAPRRHIHRFEISFPSMVRALLIVGTIWLIDQVWQTLLIVLLALILVGTLHPIIVKLQRRGIPRGWAIAGVFTGLLGIMTMIIIVTVPPLLRQVVDFISHLPEIQNHVAELFEQHRMTAWLARNVREFEPRGLLAGIDTIDVSTRIFTYLGYGITILFLALYLIIDSQRVLGALHSMIPERHHRHVRRILVGQEEIVGGYVRGQVLTSLLMAAFFWLMLVVAGVPGALSLAVFAAVTDVLPFIGGTIATIPAAVATYAARGPVWGIVVVALSIAYQEFESRYLIPRIYGRTLRMPASAVIVALLVGGQLMGIIGALIALPIAAGLRLILRELRYEIKAGLSDSDCSAEMSTPSASSSPPAPPPAVPPPAAP
jgi:putative heme transporter